MTFLPLARPKGKVEPLARCLRRRRGVRRERAYGAVCGRGAPKAASPRVTKRLQLASNRVMMPIRLAACILVGVSAWCADPPPEFTAAGIARGAEPAKMIVPGSFLSIYGRHLSAPPGTCATTVNGSDYPVEICGTQVLIGGRPTGLLYVSETQINLKVPPDLPESDRMEVRVVHNGQSSLPVTLKAGFEKTTVSLEQPAYAGLPVWLKVELPFELGSIHYPYVLGPAGFGCNEVEVRRNGVPLTLKPGSNWSRYGMVFAGNVCGSYGPTAPPLAGRLPLHLLYQMDFPGTYEVRFTLWTMPVGMLSQPQTKFRARSEWTPIELLPSTPQQRADWLQGLRNHPPEDSARVLADVLPSLLAMPGDASLEVLTGYLYHPNESVRRYAMDGLSYWPEDSTSLKLLALLHSRGPSDVMVRFLMRQPPLRAARAVEILEASLPFLKSESPVLVAGAIEAIQHGPHDGPAVLDALLESAVHVDRYADAQSAANLTQWLAETKSETAHSQIRRFVEEGRDYALAPLAAFADAKDLPLLGSTLVERASDDHLVPLPSILYSTYKDAALPYLERALSAAPGRFTSREIALQLMIAGSPTGYQFAARAIAQRGPSRMDLIQAIKGHFAELTSASDEKVIAFVKERTGEKQMPH